MANRRLTSGGTRDIYPETYRSRWVTALHARRGFNTAGGALAATHARIVGALRATGRTDQLTAAGP